MAKIIGIRASAFKSKETGEAISGKNFYLSYPLDKDKGEGLGCERVYLTDAKLANCGHTYKVGDEVNPQYNRWGKCDALLPLK